MALQILFYLTYWMLLNLISIGEDNLYEKVSLSFGNVDFFNLDAGG